jgi:hypothetical protein
MEIRNLTTTERILLRKMAL